MNKNIISYVALLLTLVLGPVANALSNDDSDYSSYDDIIKELSSSRYEAPTPTTNNKSELIRFHAGLGLLTSRLNLNLPSQYPAHRTLRGYEARLGIDLFSPHWIAEGAIRSYDHEIFNGTEISLSEFDLTVSYRNRINRPLEYVIGAGMTARYLDFIGNTPAGAQANNSTPSSIFNTGLIFNFNSAIHLGAVASLRSPLVTDTADDGSLDASLRLGGQF